jgi:hypothetical protein
MIAGFKTSAVHVPGHMFQHSSSYFLLCNWYRKSRMSAISFSLYGRALSGLLLASRSDSISTTLEHSVGPTMLNVDIYAGELIYIRHTP